MAYAILLPPCGPCATGRVRRLHAVQVSKCCLDVHVLRYHQTVGHQHLGEHTITLEQDVLADNDTARGAKKSARSCGELGIELLFEESYMSVHLGTS
jgi:hypothetical protein